MHFRFETALCVRFHDGTNVFRQLRSLDFQTWPAPRRKTLQTTHALPEFMQPFGDRFTSPAEAAFRDPRIAVPQFQGHFRHEQPPLVALQTMRSLLKQRLVTLHGVFHDLALGG